MQNDLISRSALIKHLTDWRLQEAPYGICDEETETYKTICECIEAVKEQPTAYDVEKVVAELEEEKQRLKVLKNDCIALSDSEVIAIEEKAYNFAIERIRNGGKE